MQLSLQRCLVQKPNGISVNNGKRQPKSQTACSLQGERRVDRCLKPRKVGLRQAAAFAVQQISNSPEMASWIQACRQQPNHSHSYLQSRRGTSATADATIEDGGWPCAKDGVGLKGQVFLSSSQRLLWTH